MSRSLSLLVSLSAFALIAAPAVAQPVETRSEVVSYADLDLKAPGDVDILLDRIHTAARHVCDDGPGVQPLAGNRDEQTCRSVAQEDAITSSGNAYLIARYRGYEPNVIISENDATVVTTTTVTVKKPVYG